MSEPNRAPLRPQRAEQATPPSENSRGFLRSAARDTRVVCIRSLAITTLLNPVENLLHIPRRGGLSENRHVRHVGPPSHGGASEGGLTLRNAMSGAEASLTLKAQTL